MDRNRPGNPPGSTAGKEESTLSGTFLIASGKGGVGKSTLAAGLGAALASLGSSTVILDADIGLRGQDALLGLENQVVYDLLDVISGDCELEQALLPVPRVSGLWLLPAAQFARARALDAKSLRRVIRSLRTEHDFVLIDCPAGIERGFRNVANTGICEPILVTSPDDISMRDAERACSILQEKTEGRPRLIVNRLNADLVHTGEMYSAETVAQTLDCPLLAEIPEDPLVYRALLRHTSFMQLDCPARQAVIRAARRLRGEDVPFPHLGAVRSSLWQRLRQLRVREVPSLHDL